MSDAIIFDFEVFKYNTLLGVLVSHNNEYYIEQMWDLNAIRQFYKLNQNNLWVGHNNDSYDNHILTY